MTQSNGALRSLTGSFGIISPDTNQVQTFEGDVPSDYLMANEPAPSYLSHDEPEEYPGDPVDVEEGVNTAAIPASPVMPAEPLPAHPRLPKLSRSASLPVDAQLGHLRPPSRTQSSLLPSSYDEVSRELADAVQAIVQTLLHLSPPHILDPVKELFSACTVQLPTPSVSALLTIMKNLNYLSANLRSLTPGSDSQAQADSGNESNADAVSDNFDIGEVVQSVGDVLGGVAAQAGVDLAIFHGDVGMRHINVMGDEQAILFILTHVRCTILKAFWCYVANSNRGPPPPHPDHAPSPHIGSAWRRHRNRSTSYVSRSASTSIRRPTR